MNNRNNHQLYGSAQIPMQQQQQQLQQQQHQQQYQQGNVIPYQQQQYPQHQQQYHGQQQLMQQPPQYAQPPMVNQGYNSQYAQHAPAPPPPGMYGGPIINHAAQPPQVPYQQPNAYVYHPAPPHPYTQPIPPPPPRPPPPPPPRNNNHRGNQHCSFLTNNNPACLPATNTNTQKQKFTCVECKNLEFPSLTALTAHRAAHTTCRAPGCTFTASEKLVNAHYSSTHGKFSGRGLKTISIQIAGARGKKSVQKFKVCVGNHPDDVQKWIEERRKRFPTRGAIERKLKDEERRKAEGGELYDARKQVERGRLRAGQPPTVQSGAVAGAGVDTATADTTNNAGAKKEIDKNALTSLVGGYGSSSDENDDAIAPPAATPTDTTEPRCATITPTVTPTVTPDKRRLCRFHLQGTCMHGETCKFRHTDETDTEKTQRLERKRNLQSQRDKERNSKKRKDKSTGLLERLLEKDMQRESSLTLQCLRYIVDCNYLQKQSDSGIDPVVNDVQVTDDVQLSAQQPNNMETTVVKLTT